MKVTYLIHGFRVSDNGARTTSMLTPLLKRHGGTVVNHGYGRFGLLQVLWRNKSVARKLARRIRANTVKSEDQVYAVGHSNGCAILLQALKMGAKFESILLINPALNINTKFPAGVKHIYVVHTEHDDAVASARFFDSIPIVEWLIPDAWGAMGQKGAQNKDPRVINFDYTKMLDGHSALFKEPYLSTIGAFLAEALYCHALNN